MSLQPPDAPDRSLTTIIRCLSLAIAGYGLTGRLPNALITLIVDRLRGIAQRVVRIADRLRAGTYVPRRSGPRRPPTRRQERRADPLPRKAAWLLRLVPEAAQFRAQFEHLLRDPEMAALIAAAPAAMRRPLRSFCHMLGTSPPESLAPPASPRPPAAHPAPPPSPTPPSPTPPSPPPRPMAPDPPPPQACGSPLPA